MLSSPSFADCVTLTQIAPLCGSYFTAYSLAASGMFGDPVAIVGRSKLFSAERVGTALAERAAKRKSPTHAGARGR